MADSERIFSWIWKKAAISGNTLRNLFNAGKRTRVTIRMCVLCLAGFVLLSACFNTVCAQDEEKDVFELEAEGSYLGQARGSESLARELALFDAQRQAVETAGRYLAGKKLVETYERRKEEIYSLATKEIQSETMQAKCSQSGKAFSCRVSIRARVHDSDFVRAEMRNMKMEREDAGKSFREEMEPRIFDKIDPAVDIARGFRLLRQGKWRMAMIYIDRLEKKYPDWGRLYMAKAMVFYTLHEPSHMRRALEKACQLGSREACDDLKSLKKVNNQDLDSLRFDQ